MKISEIEIFQIGQRPPKEKLAWNRACILVRLTSSDGTVGYGEARTALRNQPVIEAIREVSRVYSGRDPFDVEKNMYDWRMHDYHMSISLESTTAVSAFDMACWDIIGKQLGAPIYKLIGGLFRQRIRAYGNGWYAGCVAPEQFAQRAREYQGMGYTALKFDPFGDSYDYIDGNGLQAAYNRVKAVHEATGGKVRILVEHHGRFNAESAIRIARKLREFDPLFMEEPIHPENVEALKKYRSATDLPVALGERLLTKEQVSYILSNDLTDFLQIDVSTIGGITQARKTAAMAEAYGVQMAFHNASGPIQNVAGLQIEAAIPNFLIHESFYDSYPSWKKLLTKGKPTVEQGYISVPDGPGLGVEVDEKILTEYRIEGQEEFSPSQPIWTIQDTWKAD